MQYEAGKKLMKDKKWKQRNEIAFSDFDLKGKQNETQRGKVNPEMKQKGERSFPVM
jgi:hypothetical protein